MVKVILQRERERGPTKGLAEYLWVFFKGPTQNLEEIIADL